MLKQNLLTLRESIRQFELDKGCPPLELEELVTLNYLRSLPLDPITGRDDSWVVVRLGAYPLDELPHCPRRVVWDVRSGSDELGLEGQAYSSW